MSKPLVVSAGLLLLLAGCASPDTDSVSAPPISSGPSATLSPVSTPTPVRVPSVCPSTMPEPSGVGPAGAFVPPNPTDALVCRYNRASKLVSGRVLPHTLAVGLATDLNHAKPANPAIRCPAPTTWTIWIFRAPTPVTVKAGWCNQVIGPTRAITLPHTDSMR